MPGSISNSYDPEWGTAANGQEIIQELDDLYAKVSTILGDKPPIYILDLVRQHFDPRKPLIGCQMTEKEWRIIRFALERARESI